MFVRETRTFKAAGAHRAEPEVREAFFNDPPVDNFSTFNLVL